MKFEFIERPEKNRHRIHNELDYDRNLEAALLETLDCGMAIKVPLGLFHSSPCKGRLWLKGYHVRHRVIEGREYVAAWLEMDEPEEEEPVRTEQLLLM